jgi:hypothetical protein
MKCDLGVSEEDPDPSLCISRDGRDQIFLQRGFTGGGGPDDPLCGTGGFRFAGGQDFCA